MNSYEYCIIDKLWTWLNKRKVKEDANTFQNEKGKKKTGID